jgi:hypothetical protein
VRVVTALSLHHVDGEPRLVVGPSVREATSRNRRVSCGSGSIARLPILSPPLQNEEPESSHHFLQLVIAFELRTQRGDMSVSKTMGEAKAYLGDESATLQPEHPLEGEQDHTSVLDHI